MLIVELNGRPVMVGTKLDYVDADCKSMWGDDYLIVTEVTATHGIDYVGNAGEIQGNISLKELPNVFKHHEELVTETGNIKTYGLSHITDLLAIPDDKLDIALDELKLALRTVRLGVAAKVQIVSEDIRVQFTPEDIQTLARNSLPVLVWQDNGENKTTLNIGDESISAELKPNDS